MKKSNEKRGKVARNIFKLSMFLMLLITVIGCNGKNVKEQRSGQNKEMPTKGMSAHRGAIDTHPENTIAAFEEAVRLGAHQIEFDVRMTKDGKLIIMHDRTLERTTNGSGLVSDITFEEIRKLDAGSWKSEKFSGEKVPTFKETLAIMPENVWLNIHLKGEGEIGEKLGEATAAMLVSENRIHQGFISCGVDAAVGVKKVNSNILIGNMERRDSRERYIDETIETKDAFLQLKSSRDDGNLSKDVKRLHENNIKVNYFLADTDEEVRKIFNDGVDFILTNKLAEMMKVAESMGIKPLENK